LSLLIVLSIPLLTIGDEQDITLVQHTEQFIFEGRVDVAEENTLAFVSENNTSDTSKAHLFTMAGEIKKLSGDMEGALFYWKKGNALRSRIFPKGDYHLVWNHALISNYHYEMINPQHAKIYADSCMALLND